MLLRLFLGDGWGVGGGEWGEFAVAGGVVAEGSDGAEFGGAAGGFVTLGVGGVGGEGCGGGDGGGFARARWGSRAGSGRGRLVGGLLRLIISRPARRKAPVP